MKSRLPLCLLALGFIFPVSLDAQTKEETPAPSNAVGELGKAPANTDNPSLPDEITVTKQSKVTVKQNDGTTGSAVLPAGAKFRPTGIDGDRLTVDLENGVASILISNTNYEEQNAALNEKAASEEVKLGESVVLEVQVGKNIPGGFLSDNRRIDGGVVEERVAVIGLPDSKLQVGEWWTGNARKLGHYTPDGGTSVYTQYQATPNFPSTAAPAPGDKPNAPEVTFAEMKKLYDSLDLEQWLTLTQRVNNNINQRGTYQIDTNDLLQLGVKKEQINYIRDSIPTWNSAAETARDWIDNRNMQPSYKRLCELIIKANSLLGPNSIATMRNYVKQIEKQWDVIQTIDGKEPVPDDQEEANLTP